MKNYKKVYLYTIDDKLVKEFKTTDECAEYMGKDTMYLYHNIKYCKKIWFNNKWYKLSRTLINPIGKQQDY